MYPQLDNVIQYRLEKIHEIKNYFITEIRERESMSKIFIKYIAAFDYADQTLFACFINNKW